MSDHFNEIRKVLDFFLDEKGEVWARFTAEDDQREFPLKSLVIQAQLEGVIGLDLSGKKEEIKLPLKMQALTYEIVRYATKKYRPKKERDDEAFLEEPLLFAFVVYAAKKLGKTDTWIDEGPTELRNHLVEVVKPECPHADQEIKTGAQFTKEVKKLKEAGSSGQTIWK